LCPDIRLTQRQTGNGQAGNKKCCPHDLSSSCGCRRLKGACG
jgi:hypothetical protein